MQIVIPATAAGIAINPLPQSPPLGIRDARKILVQNPEENTVNITFHQGFEGPDSDPIQLKPGELVSLNASRPVFLGTVGNVGANARYNHFC